MTLKPKFLLIGLFIAFLEEFITQGVLKRSLLGWIVPTVFAFLPFLVAVHLIRNVLHSRMAKPRSVLAHYVVAGGIGLGIEWFIIGLSPWSNLSVDPLLMLIFQLGMFSFWGTVGFAPELLLDQWAPVARVRKWYGRFLVAGFAFIYLVTFSTPREAQFGAGIGSVLLVFISMNAFYLMYIRTLTRHDKTDAPDYPVGSARDPHG